MTNITWSSLLWWQGKENVNPRGKDAPLMPMYSRKSEMQYTMWSKSWQTKNKKITETFKSYKQHMISIRNVNLSLKNMQHLVVLHGASGEKSMFFQWLLIMLSLCIVCLLCYSCVCVEKSISQYKCSHNVLKDMTTTIHVPHININIF